MLDDPGEQAVEVGLDRLAGERPGLDDDPLGPPHVHPDARQAQAALLLDRGAAGPAEHRIDEDVLLSLAPLAGAVDDEHPVGKRHLVGGQADSLGLVHDLEHAGHRLADRLIEPHQRPGRPPQGGMGIFDQGQRADGGGVSRGGGVGHVGPWGDWRATSFIISPRLAAVAVAVNPGSVGKPGPCRRAGSRPGRERLTSLSVAAAGGGKWQIVARCREVECRSAWLTQKNR